MDIKILTKNELMSKKEELEKEFNTVKDKLANFIESTHATIKGYTDNMDKLSEEYKKINEELDKRNGNATGK